MNREDKTFPRFESRFQRSPVSGLQSWGDAPGFDENAPLALKRNAGRVGPGLSSAKGAAFNGSLGQRHRSLIQSKSPALKARFILEMRR